MVKDCRDSSVLELYVKKITYRYITSKYAGILRSGGGKLQYLNGSPVNPLMHVQVGKWLIV